MWLRYFGAAEKGNRKVQLKATSTALTSRLKPRAAPTKRGLRALIEQMRQEGRRRALRRRLGPDPIQVIDSPSAAFDVADQLLACAPRRDVSEQLWASVAVSPLAGVLFAASAQGNGGGLEWAHRALSNVDAGAGVPCWRQAADICGRAPGLGSRLGEALLRVMALDPRQRGSVRVVMSDALGLVGGCSGTAGTRLRLC